jgi:protein ImuB
MAQEFSPRYETHGERLVAIDVSGLGRLLGPPRVIGEEMRRDAAQRGARVHIAIAGTHTAARLLALARPGLTIVDRGGEPEAAAPIPIGILEKISDERDHGAIAVFTGWGLKTLGELAALPAAALSARAGRSGLRLQAIARGEDARPLLPDQAEERFDASLELEWPIEGLEPLSFVLTRLLEPLSLRLERRDRGAAALHVELGLVSDRTACEIHARTLQLPAPIRDVRTLRTLALLDIESHAPAAAVERVRIVIDPTPGKVVQHTLFTRTRAMPEQLSTLLARLGALMGQDRVGTPAVVDSHRSGAFAMEAFATEQGDYRHDDDHDDHRRDRRTRREPLLKNSANSASSAVNVVMSALRRCRRPIPARVVVAAAGDGTSSRPVRVTTDRQGFAGGAVLSCAGPWRTSGDWWEGNRANPPSLPPWNRDEWDVALGDGAAYRIFRDRDSDAWFIDGIVD